MAVPTINIDGRGPIRINKGRGLKMMTGTISFTAADTHATSNIEKYFRRCHEIQTNISSGTSAVYVVWKKSTERLNGQFKSYGYSTGAGADPLQNFALAAAGTFVAFGS